MKLYLEDYRTCYQSLECPTIFGYSTVNIQTLTEFKEVSGWRSLLYPGTAAISWMAIDGVISCAFRGGRVNIRQ